MSMPERRRVLFVSYFFPPLGGAGVQRPTKFVKYLPAAGWDPTVITTRSRWYPVRDETLVGDVPPGVRVAGAREPESNRAIAPSACCRDARRVTVYPPRDEHDEYPVAARDRPLYDLAVVGCARHDVDPATEHGELADALLAAHGNHLVPPIQRVLDHVPPELPGCADDADPHDTLRLQSISWG